MKTCKFDLWPVKTTSAEMASLVIAIVGVSALILAAILGMLYQAGGF